MNFITKYDSCHNRLKNAAVCQIMGNKHTGCISSCHLLESVLLTALNLKHGINDVLFDIIISLISLNVEDIKNS